MVRGTWVGQAESGGTPITRRERWEELSLAPHRGIQATEQGHFAVGEHGGWEDSDATAESGVNASKAGGSAKSLPTERALGLFAGRLAPLFGEDLLEVAQCLGLGGAFNGFLGDLLDLLVSGLQLARQFAVLLRLFLDGLFE